MVSKPQKIIVPQLEALAWLPGAALYQEKLDGCFAARAFDSSLIAGEQMSDGRFIAFDCLRYQGQDLADRPTRERWRALLGWFQDIKNSGCTGGPFSQVSIVGTDQCQGGAFVLAVLERGGEGVVAKDWDAPYSAPMLAVKRIWEGRCVVTGFCGGTQSVEIADAGTGQARGRVALRAGKCDRVRVGSIIKVQGMNLTERGKVREARICSDTPDSWLVQY